MCHPPVATGHLARRRHLCSCVWLRRFDESFVNPPSDPVWPEIRGVDPTSSGTCPPQWPPVFSVLVLARWLARARAMQVRAHAAFLLFRHVSPQQGCSEELFVLCLRLVSMGREGAGRICILKTWPPWLPEVGIDLTTVKGLRLGGRSANHYTAPDRLEYLINKVVLDFL